MYPIDSDGAVDSQFSDGNPQTGQEATVINSAWLNRMQAEVINAVEGAGLELDQADDAQLEAAIKILSAPDLAGVSYVSATQIQLAGPVGRVAGQPVELESNPHTLTITTTAGTVHYEYVYLEAPAEGRLLGAGEISHSTEAPTWDSDSGGWYDATGEKRCVAAVLVGSNNLIYQFTIAQGWYMPTVQVPVINTTSPAGSRTAVSVYAPALGPMVVNLNLMFEIWGATSGRLAIYADSQQLHGIGGQWPGISPTVLELRGSCITVTNSSQQIGYSLGTDASGAKTAIINMVGWKIPRGLAL